MLQLPRTAGCIVCGRDNPHGLRLTSYVNVDDDTVQTQFTPMKSHIGFQGIIHGGVLATVLDEIMVWAATWRGKRFCLAGEMTTRFRRPVGVGDETIAIARIVSMRGRLVTAESEIRRGDQIVVEATGKYFQISPEEHQAFIKTLVDEPESDEALTILRG